MDTPSTPTEPTDPLASADIPQDTPQPPAPLSASTTPSSTLPDDDVAAIDQLGEVYRAFKDEIGKVIIG